ncbi:hypothetical protein [Rothia kristinae]|uniref:hypothetical protein n=1 Tax=Rothia kristinae TaxID=37923 RepID=UPI0011A6BE5F|nr:hypothetical protein [Rothia kristinae]
MTSVRSFTRRSTAALAVVGAVLLATAPAADAADWRDWLDPTKVIETDPTPASAQGRIDSLSVTDAADGDHEVPAGTPARAHVRAEASGYTPGQTYTVRITARTADTGQDWGVYTWQSYTTDDAGRLHVDLRMSLPGNRAAAGERIVLVPRIYRAEDVRRDGRPAKQNPRCVLHCPRVAPAAAWTDLTDPAATLVFR